MAGEVAWHGRHGSVWHGKGARVCNAGYAMACRQKCMQVRRCKASKRKAKKCKSPSPQFPDGWRMEEVE